MWDEIIHEEHEAARTTSTCMSVVLLTGWWDEDLLPLMHTTADLRMAKESLHLNQPTSCTVRKFSLVGKQSARRL